MLFYFLVLVVFILFVVPFLIPGIDALGVLGGLFNVLVTIIRFTWSLIAQVF